MCKKFTPVEKGTRNLPEEENNNDKLWGSPEKCQVQNLASQKKTQNCYLLGLKTKNCFQ